jgi:hypothetical protein
MLAACARRCDIQRLSLVTQAAIGIFDCTRHTTQSQVAHACNRRPPSFYTNQKRTSTPRWHTCHAIAARAPRRFIPRADHFPNAWPLFDGGYGGNDCDTTMFMMAVNSVADHYARPLERVCTGERFFLNFSLPPPLNGLLSSLLLLLPPLLRLEAPNPASLLPALFFFSFNSTTSSTATLPSTSSMPGSARSVAHLRLFHE